MPMPDINLLESGIFTIRDVAQLTRIPVARVRRWMRGYNYRKSTGRAHSEPLWGRTLPQFEGSPTLLSFNELIEIRAIGKFSDAGVSLRRIRRAILDFENIDNIKFPFSNRHIITDGKQLYAKLIVGGKEVFDAAKMPILMNLDDRKSSRTQTVSYTALLTSIVSGLGFDDDHVSKLTPYPEFARVVVDPRRAFGHPILDDSRLEVEVIALAAKSNPSIEYVADWFGIEKESVREAVSFHNRLRAA